MQHSQMKSRLNEYEHARYNLKSLNLQICTFDLRTIKIVQLAAVMLMLALINCGLLSNTAKLFMLPDVLIITIFWTTWKTASLP